jgi:hypothetical protein
MRSTLGFLFLFVLAPSVFGSPSLNLTCQRIVGNETVKKYSERTDILSRYRNGQATPSEDAIVREVMIKAFFGKSPVLFSLNHLLGYDRALALNGIHPPLKLSALPKEMKRSQKQKIWAREQEKYSAQLVEFSERLEKMSDSERLSFAKQVADGIYYQVDSQFVAPEDFSENLKDMPVRNRLPKKQVEKLKARTDIMNEIWESTMAQEVIERLVYESLIPLSKLAVTDRIKDRVGGRLAYQIQNGDGRGTVRGWIFTLALASPLILDGMQRLGTGAGNIELTSGWVGAPALGIAAGFFSHKLITSAIRVPETIDDGMSTLRENRARNSLYRQLEKPTTSRPVEPVSQIIEEEISSLNLQSLSAEKDLKKDSLNLSKYGEELQTALGYVVDLHANLIFEEISEVKSIAPLLELMKNGASTSDEIKIRIAGKSPEIERDLGKLDFAFFQAAKDVLKLRRLLQVIDQKFDDYVGVLSSANSQTKSDEKVYFEHRLTSLQQSKQFVQIQLDALGLSDKKILESLRNVEAIRTILMSAQSTPK